MTLAATIQAAHVKGAAVVAAELALAGLTFNSHVSNRLRTEFKRTTGVSLFLKCVAEAATWAGWINDPSWLGEATGYLQSQSHHRRDHYTQGFHRSANAFTYLDTWIRLINNLTFNLPDESTSPTELIEFYHEAFNELRQLKWMKQGAQLGAWTFHGAFKIFLLHEQRLWPEPSIDKITMPTGGESAGYSFERGWQRLQKLKRPRIVQRLGPSNEAFDDDIRRATDAHVQVVKLAGLAQSRAVHVNSGIYALGHE